MLQTLAVSPVLECHVLYASVWKMTAMAKAPKFNVSQAFMATNVSSVWIDTVAIKPETSFAMQFGTPLPISAHMRRDKRTNTIYYEVSRLGEAN